MCIRDRRESIQNPAIPYAAVLDNQVGYINLSTFSGNPSKAVSYTHLLWFRVNSKFPSASEEAAIYSSLTIRSFISCFCFAVRMEPI